MRSYVFLQEHGVPGDWTRTVWQSIALHTSVGLAHRFGTDHAVAFLGISLDINGLDQDRLPNGFVERVNSAWPRHDLGYAIAELIADGTQLNPLKAPPFSFPAHVHALLNGPSVTFHDVIDVAPGAISL